LPRQEDAVSDEDATAKKTGKPKSFPHYKIYTGEIEKFIVSYVTDRPDFYLMELSAAIGDKFKMKAPTRANVKRWVSTLRAKGILDCRPKKKLSPLFERLIREYVGAHPHYKVIDVVTHLQSHGLQPAVCYNSVKRWIKTVISSDRFNSFSDASELDGFIIKYIMTQHGASDAVIAHQIQGELKKGRGPPVIIGNDTLLKLVGKLRQEVEEAGLT
jgi:hypothetical protein